MKKIIALCIVYSIAGLVFAENIDPYQTDAQYAYAENVGWINFQPVYGGGVQVSSSAVTGKAWGKNVGWINFDPVVPGDVSNQYKVTIDADGYFSGWAYGENIGWIHFNETQNWSVQAYVVTLDDLTNFASYWQDFCPDGWQLK